jgi:hypothetical protein
MFSTTLSPITTSIEFLARTNPEKLKTMRLQDSAIKSLIAIERSVYSPESMPTETIQPATNVKEGVSELFDSTPELASIGTPQQYSAYLDTIFPESKVQDIVYHGTHTRFNKFDKSLSGSKTKASINGKGFFFSNSLGIAQGYRQSLEQSNIYNDVIFYYYFKRDLANKNIKDLTQEEWQEIILNYFGSEDLNVQYLQKQSLDKTKELFEKFKNDKQFDTVQYVDELDFSEYLKDDSIVYSALLEVNNPLVVEGNNYQMLSIVKKEIEKLEENNDSIIFNNVEDGMSGSYRGVANTYTVFEPEQIHILGNKQDIAGFKKFVNAATTQPSTSVLKENEVTIVKIEERRFKITATNKTWKNVAQGREKNMTSLSDDSYKIKDLLQSISEKGYDKSQENKAGSNILGSIYRDNYLDLKDGKHRSVALGILFPNELRTIEFTKGNDTTWDKKDTVETLRENNINLISVTEKQQLRTTQPSTNPNQNDINNLPNINPCG